MNIVFYLSAAVAIVSTALVLANEIPVHALLYLIVSLLAVALIFFTLGAPFVAALEVIIYAGAIMVLFVFVIMMLNLSSEERDKEKVWWTPQAWLGPAILALILIGELVYALSRGSMQQISGTIVTPQQLGIALYSPYLLGVELASLVLLSGLVGAYHLGHQERPEIGKAGDM